MAKKILALGGCGFIGSYVVKGLLADGHRVSAVDNFSKYGEVKHAFFDHKNFDLIRKDVRSLTPADYKGYDIILCFAALIGGIRYFHKIPYKIARDNTEIMVSSIDAVLEGAPEAVFYYFSSSMVYERMKRPVTEEDALQQPVPITNYGMQKLFGEFLVRGAKEERGLNYVIVRPFNAVGSGELPEIDSKGQVEFGMAHVIPDFIYKALVKQAPFEIMGDGKQVRTFTHARDIAAGISLMISKNVQNDDFNLCGNNTLPMGELAEFVWSRINPGQAFPGFKHMPTPHDDVAFRVGTAEKAKRVLGWVPSADLEFIVRDTADYVAAHLSKLQ